MKRICSQEFICFICERILKEATYLPCKCKSICRKHLILDEETRKPMRKCENRASITIKCSICGNISSLLINEHVFEANEEVQYKIENAFHLDHKETELKISIEKSISGIRLRINNFKETIYDFSLIQCEHFLSLKNEIDIKRELVLQDAYSRTANNVELGKFEQDIHKVLLDFYLPEGLVFGTWVY
jgi:hypothetical protein